MAAKHAKLTTVNAPDWEQDTPQEWLVRELARIHPLYKGENGRDYVKCLDEIVDEADRKDVYKLIPHLVLLQREISKERGLGSSADSASHTDPLAVTRLLAELRAQNAPLEVDYRKIFEEEEKLKAYASRKRPQNDAQPGKSKPSAPGFRVKDKSQVKPAIIYAAILYSAFPFDKKSGEVDPGDAARIPGYVARVPGVFGKGHEEVAKETVDILRGALMLSELELGSPPSDIYLDTKERAPTPEERAQANIRRTQGFLEIPHELGIPPGSTLLRDLTQALVVRDKIENRNSYSQSDLDETAQSLSNVYVPLTARDRQDAFQEGDLSTANLLETIKTQFKNQILKLSAEDEYKQTKEKILEFIRENVAPEDKAHNIKTMREARSIGLNSIGQMLVPLIPPDLLKNVKIITRLKSVASVHKEVMCLYEEDVQERAEKYRKENSGAEPPAEKPLTYQRILDKYLPQVKDLIGFRFIVTNPEVDPKEDPEEIVQQKEHESADEVYRALSKGVQKLGGRTITFIVGRKKDLSKDKDRETFFKGRDDTGYRAIHDGMFILARSHHVMVEGMFTGEIQHGKNEFSAITAHDRYKGEVNGEGDSGHIHIISDTGDIIKVPRGSTVADALAILFGNREKNPERAFTAVKPEVERTLHHYGSGDPPTQRTPLKGENTEQYWKRLYSQTLQPYDRLLLPRMARDLLTKPGHLQLVTNCATTEEGWNILATLAERLSPTKAAPASRPEDGNGNPKKVMNLHW